MSRKTIYTVDKAIFSVAVKIKLAMEHKKMTIEQFMDITGLGRTQATSATNFGIDLKVSQLVKIEEALGIQLLNLK